MYKISQNIIQPLHERVPQMSDFLEIRNLTKDYRKVRGIDDVSFACREGSLTVLLGPSGAGKTTTLNIVAGILQESSGDVLRDGKSLRGVPARDRKISMTFEDYVLYPTHSIYENIASPLRAQKQRNEEIDARVRRIAEVVGIHEHLEKLPAQVSGGQKQRTALARCLVREADIYLLDEPIAHLDAKLRHRMRAEFKRIHKELGKTMIYVTHDYREALALADTIVVLDKGRVIQTGSPDEVFSRPINTFVATLLGEPPMNLVDFEVRADRDGTLLLGKGDTDFAMSGVPVAAIPRRVKLGFRHFNARLQKTRGEHSVEGSIYVTESIEDARVFTVAVGDNLIKVVTPRDTQFEINQRVFIEMNPKAVHLFDGDSGRRIEMRK